MLVVHLSSRSGLVPFHFLKCTLTPRPEGLDLRDMSSIEVSSLTTTTRIPVWPPPRGLHLAGSPELGQRCGRAVAALVVKCGSVLESRCAAYLPGIPHRPPGCIMHCTWVWCTITLVAGGGQVPRPIT